MQLPCILNPGGQRYTVRGGLVMESFLSEEKKYELNMLWDREMDNT